MKRSTLFMVAITAAALLAVLAWRWLKPTPVAGEEFSQVGEAVCVDGRQYICHQDRVECGGGSCIGAVLGQFFAEDPVWVIAGQCD
jgi:hypothetical protein